MQLPIIGALYELTLTLLSSLSLLFPFTHRVVHHTGMSFLPQPPTLFYTFIFQSTFEMLSLSLPWGLWFPLLFVIMPPLDPLHSFTKTSRPLHSQGGWKNMGFRAKHCRSPSPWRTWQAKAALGETPFWAKLSFHCFGFNWELLTQKGHLKITSEIVKTFQEDTVQCSKTFYMFIIFLR